MDQTLQKIRQTAAGQVIDVRSVGPAKGKPIVLVHGIGASGDYFVPLALELAHEYAVYVLDLPGYGTTPKPDTPLTISELAGVVGRFVHSRSLVDPVFIGHSMGCQVVAQVLKQYPGLSTKSILLSPTISRTERHVVVQAFRLLQDTFREPLRVNLVIMKNYFRMGIKNYLITVGYMMADKTEESLRGGVTKLLILRGRRDSIVPQRWIDYLAKVTGAETSEIKAAAHVVQFTHSQEVARRCHAFIS